MKKFFLLHFLALLCLNACETNTEKKSNFSINVSFSDAIAQEALDGRLLLMFSNNGEAEPRFQINDGLQTQMIFGMNVDGMKAGESKTFDGDIFGFPYPSLAQVPPGEYSVQALLHVYETFDLSTGHTVKLPMDNGEGQQWNRSPGNLYSKPFKVTVTEAGLQDINVVMDQVIPPIVEPQDTEWVKH
ncbi:MAG: hypothetical protein WBN39_14795, partial [Flavobacteriaceae bacterium]